MEGNREYEEKLSKAGIRVGIFKSGQETCHLRVLGNCQWLSGRAGRGSARAKALRQSSLEVSKE